MNLLTPILDALAFRKEGLTTFKKSPLVFWRGVLALVIIGLIVGLFRADADELVRARRPAQTASQVISEVDSAFRDISFGGLPREFIVDSIRQGVLMGFEIAALPPRAGLWTRPLEAALTFVGHWARTPFGGGWLPTLLLIGMFTQLAALVLGGRGALDEMLGLGALAVAPALLSIVTIALSTIDTLSNLPAASGLGSLISLLIFGWQAAIYTQAISIAHEVTIPRALAILAVALAFMIAAGFVLLLILIVFTAGVVATLR